MGQTDTIRQRRVDVWVPSLEAKEKWKEAAAERCMSLSGLIIQLVEEALNEGLGTAKDMEELRRCVSDLEAEIARRDEQIRDLRELKDRLEDELQEYRAQDLLKPRGMKILDRRLIAVLAEAKDTVGRPRVVGEDELLKRLKASTADQVAALALQLEALEMHGVVRATPNGWVWHDS